MKEIEAKVAVVTSAGSGVDATFARDVAEGEG